MPKIRLRGPKFSSNKVTIANEFYLQDGNSQGHKLNVIIRLSPHVLKQITYPFADDDSNAHIELEKPNLLKEAIQSKPNSDDDNDNDNDNDYESGSDDSSLSSLDFHINQELQAYDNETKNQINDSNRRNNNNQHRAPINNAAADIIPTVKKERVSPIVPKTTTIYKPIPPNITPIIENEFSDLSDQNVDFGIIDKVVFSLKDPLSACKIKLPVKSNFCVHFECFDFETFCIFNKIPPGIQAFTRKNLTRKSFEKLAYQTNGQTYPSPIRIVDVRKYEDKKDKHKENNFSKIPIYSCPFCDIKFLIHDLSISDSFNYFVKSTPNDSEKIELLGMKKYRIIQDSVKYRSNSVKPDDDIIVLTDDEDDNDGDEESNGKFIDVKGDNHSEEPTQVDSTQEVFNDGLDEALLKLSKNGNNVNKDFGGSGSGSWDDPFTID